MKFRKKPVVIEAMQWKGFSKDHWQEMYNFCMPGDIKTCVLTGPHPDDRITIDTLEGLMFANVGDYIIKGVKGEFYPCKPEIFLLTYEPVEDN